MRRMSAALPEGVRASLPARTTARHGWRDALTHLYASWGYQPVDLPALERYDPNHPRAAQAFKLTDRDGGLLALRSDMTPAVARLVQRTYPHLLDPDEVQRPVRLQVAGTVWQAIDPEVTRTREFTQVGVEFIGVRDPRADAELIHLARESIRLVGLRPRVEVGNPGFVKALMDEADVPEAARERLADAIDRKDVGDVRAVLEAAGVPEARGASLLATPDLYGATHLLRDAERLATGEASSAALSYLAGTLAEFDDESELLLDLGMARRLSYYTGLTFRAYTLDYGQPLLGGGRYDGALLPYAAGFSIGLERLESALALGASEPPSARVLSLDDDAAQRLRRAGIAVARAIHSDPQAAREEAKHLAIPWVLSEGTLTRTPGIPVSDEEVDLEREDAERERAHLESILADANA